MGWNDISKLVLVYLLFNLILNFSTAQEKIQKGLQEPQLPPAYNLKGYYKPLVYYNYNYVDTTIVKRLYIDSSIIEYKRIITYFMTLFQPDPPKDGFAKVEVSIDSMHYKFIEGEKTYEFINIEVSDPNILKFEDFQAMSIPMGKEFTIIYSPYGEVAKIEGEKLDYYKDYVEQLKPHVRDTMSIFNWTEGLSTPRLKHIADVFKIQYPLKYVYRDSIWFSPIEMQIEGINLSDTLELKVTGFLNNKYYIEGKFSKPFVIYKPTRFYGLQNLSLPYNLVDAKGKIDLKLNAGGSVQEMTITLEANLDVGSPKIFQQTIQQILKWDLIKSYRFK
ncbi:MAG: hypothetical protein N2517_01305 [Ignavibacteria bacterium]|nr:hypothetical protein [Ignavibacteria bacterium]